LKILDQSASVGPPSKGLQDADGIVSCLSASSIPELLAPAGDWDCARAAVENGADAIYFGLEKFNARMRAHNFTESDLPSLMEYLHRRAVKGYVTFNTLVFENEMEEACQYLRTIIASGVDAAIVQDVGICRMIRQLSPDFPIHVSTQMTVSSAGGVEFARELGCNLVVLARECSLKEIEAIIKGGKSRNGQHTIPAATLPLEVFIHGALCVAYSGQCLTSESLGGRSANRGECAQACRLPYELIADGKLVPLGDRKYLLSPQDLAGLEVLPDLVRLGVSSFKIEGRLKTPEYVANITRIYRKELDKLQQPDPRSALPAHSAALEENSPRYQMEMAFSRGLYSGWFRGINNQSLVHGQFGKKRGVYLGKIREVRGDEIIAVLENRLKAGDGVVFDAGRPEEKEEGGRVYGLKPDRKGRKGSYVLSFGKNDIDFNRVHPGNRIWKTSDPELERRLRRTFEGNDPKFCRPIFLEVHGELGKPLTVLARDDTGSVARADSTLTLARAQQQPLTTERLAQQLGRLGGTPFTLGKLKNFLSDGLILPVSELNRLRRQIVEELIKLRSQPRCWTLNSVVAAGVSPCGTRFEQRSETAGRMPPSTAGETPAATFKLNVLVRTIPQLKAALDTDADILYCDFEDPKKYREAVTLFRNFNSGNSSIFVAPPRIFKMGEEWTLELVRASAADGYLVRNYDHLRFFEKERRVGDYSLNVANHLAADYFKNKFHLERVTASYDLNILQLEALLKSSPPGWFEVTIHQHMPMFHMEHCVFCAFLSKGTDYTNCGRPCDTHDLKLRDRVGAEHPVKADAGCRNTVYNSRAQTGAESVLRLVSLGASHFRLEFLNETPDEVGQTIARYQRLLSGEITGQQLWRELSLVNQLGVTRSRG
jgi:U32 family peptidase